MRYSRNKYVRKEKIPQQEVYNLLGVKVYTDTLSVRVSNINYRVFEDYKIYVKYVRESS